jgi:aspartyl protease
MIQRYDGAGARTCKAKLAHMISARRILLVFALISASGAACLGDEARAADRPIATIPFSLNGKLVSVRVGVNGSEPLRFTVDTGASASVIDAGVARRLHLRRYGVHVGRGAGAGAVRFDLFRNVRLSVGGTAAFTAPTVYGVSLGNVGTQEAEAGLLGYDFFAKYIVKIDYENRVMTLYDPAGFHYVGRASACR